MHGKRIPHLGLDGDTARPVVDGQQRRAHLVQVDVRGTGGTVVSSRLRVVRWTYLWLRRTRGSCARNASHP